MNNDGKFGYQLPKPKRKKTDANHPQNQGQQSGQRSESESQPIERRSILPIGGAAISQPKKD